MGVADLVRQAILFVVGLLLLIYDALTGPPHDWIVLVLGLVLIGLVPIEWVLRAHNGHGWPGSGSSSSGTTGTS